MKVIVLLSTLLSLAVATLVLTAPAHAQESSCQANPGPVDASDPSIVVSAPVAGEGIPASPLHVAGQARVFEATVSITLYDAAGAEIATTTTNAAEGGALSDFSTDLAFTAASNTPGCLWVYEVSARDGSPVNVVQVPLTLNATGLPSTGSGATTPGPSLFAVVAGLVLVGVVLETAGVLRLRAR